MNNIHLQTGIMDSPNRPEIVDLEVDSPDAALAAFLPESATELEPESSSSTQSENGAELELGRLRFELDAPESSSSIEPESSAILELSKPRFELTSRATFDPPEEHPIEPVSRLPGVTAGGPISLQAIMDSDVQLEWHDGVALVRQLVAQLVPNLAQEPDAGIPAFDRISLNSDGTLSAPLDVHSRTPLVTDIGRLLTQLVSGSAQPVQLRLMALQAADPVRTVSLAEVVEVLARWERPNRQAKLIALYQRARMSGVTTGTPFNAPLQVVAPRIQAPRPFVPRAPVRRTNMLSPAELDSLKNSQGGPPLRQLIGAVVVGLGVLTVSLAALAVFMRPAPTPLLATHRTASRMALLPHSDPPSPLIFGPPERKNVSEPGSGASVVGRGVAPRANVTPAAPPGSATQAGVRQPAAVTATPRSTASVSVPRANTAEDEFRRAQRLFDAKQYSSAQEGFARVARMLDGDTTPASSELRWKANEYSELARGFTGHDASIATRLYTSADPGVTEPIPLGPFLPSADLEGTTTALELVIDAKGRVESVRLTNPQDNYHTQWWLPAAKAWRFEPATKDGVPVRFLKRILLPYEQAPTR